MVSKKQMTAATQALGRRIAALRVAAGLTQEDLAERLDSSKPVVSRIENGVSLPSFTRLVEIAEALGVGLDALFAVEGRGGDPREEMAGRVAAIVRRLPVEDGEIVRGVAEVLGRRGR